MPRKSVIIGIQRCGLHPFEGWLVIQDTGAKVIAFPDNSSCHYIKKETAETIAKKKKEAWKNDGYVVKNRPSGK